MVHLVDEGSQFDASLETIWKYLGSPDEHRAAHSDHRNQQAKPLGENVVELSWEQDLGGKPVKVVNRVTMLPPVGVAIETLEGPLAGSKFFSFYTPKGPKTGVTIVGEFRSPMLPDSQIEAIVQQNFEHVFHQDVAALKKFAAKK